MTARRASELRRNSRSRSAPLHDQGNFLMPVGISPNHFLARQVFHFFIRYLATITEPILSLLALRNYVEVRHQRDDYHDYQQEDEVSVRHSASMIPLLHQFVTLVASRPDYASRNQPLNEEVNGRITEPLELHGLGVFLHCSGVL